MIKSIKFLLAAIFAWLAASTALAQQAPTAADLKALEEFGSAGQHEQLAEYVDGLSAARQIALAPLIAKHPDPDMRYIASMTYVRNDMVDEVIAAATDFAASSDLGEKHLMALGWALTHGADETGTIEKVLKGVLERLRGDLSGFTPDQQARIRKMLKNNPQ